MIEVKGGRVWGPSGAILTANGELLDEFSIEMGRTHDHPLEYKWKLPPIESTEKLTTVLSASQGGNYFHWMTDVLPRIHLLQCAGVNFADLELLVVNPIASAFQTETLARFGIPRERLRETSARFHLGPRRMIVASYPGIPGDTPKWACEFLRTSFQAPAGRGRNIYVSRRHARSRRVRNEAEVLAALRHFESAELESLSVREQAALFAGADCIVAPHGAGLTNLVFCKPGARVVELFSPNYANGCYENIARHMGLSYRSVTGAGRHISNSFVRDDMTIDPKHLP